VDVVPDETLTFIWQSPKGGETAVLAKYDVPDDIGPTASIGSITANNGESKIIVNNIQFSRVKGGEVYYEVVKCSRRNCNRLGGTSSKSGYLTDEGDLVVDLGRNSLGNEITVTVYETDEKLNRLDWKDCTVGIDCQ
jgi:hypothetical protein